MKEYKILVLGPQFSEPIMYVQYLAIHFGVSTTNQYIKKPDRLFTAEITIDNTKYVFSSVIHAIWDYENTYKTLLQHCDGIVYMLNVYKDSDFLNQKDFKIFSKYYNTLCLNMPIITLFNDIWCGKYAGELMEYAELLKYVVVNSLVFQTQIGYLPGNHCNKGGLDSLNCLIKKLASIP